MPSCTREFPEKGKSITFGWSIQEGDLYHVTGILKNGKRFPTKIYKHWHFADGVNLWQGSVWLVRNGKRKLVKRVTN